MSLKLPDKGQWAFIGLVMCLVTYYTGSVAVYPISTTGKLPAAGDFEGIATMRIDVE
ncbi:hypothetical protein Q6A29_06090 [Salmonella enterica subsp. enterica]